MEAPEEILCDNMKQVVVKRMMKQSDSELNKQFEDFTGFYGFKPVLCRPCVTVLGWSRDPGPSADGEVPHHWRVKYPPFSILGESTGMKELSIFIDESGDFGEHDYHSPWYVVAMVFHEQDNSIQEPMDYLERELALFYANVGWSNNYYN